MRKCSKRNEEGKEGRECLIRGDGESNCCNERGEVKCTKLRGGMSMERREKEIMYDRNGRSEGRR